MFYFFSISRMPGCRDRLDDIFSAFINCQHCLFLHQVIPKNILPIFVLPTLFVAVHSQPYLQFDVFGCFLPFLIFFSFSVLYLGFYFLVPPCRKFDKYLSLLLRMSLLSHLILFPCPDQFILIVDYFSIFEHLPLPYDL